MLVVLKLYYYTAYSLHIHNTAVELWLAHASGQGVIVGSSHERMAMGAGGQVRGGGRGTGG